MDRQLVNAAAALALAALIFVIAGVVCCLYFPDQKMSLSFVFALIYSPIATFFIVRYVNRTRLRLGGEEPPVKPSNVLGGWFVLFWLAFALFAGSLDGIDDVPFRTFRLNGERTRSEGG